MPYQLDSTATVKGNTLPRENEKSDLVQIDYLDSSTAVVVSGDEGRNDEPQYKKNPQVNVDYQTPGGKQG